MREHQKRQCLETLALLKEAHKEISALLAGNAFQEAAELLIQCQQGAISLGNTLDAAGDEAKEIVRQLEDYCELVYQIYTDVASGDNKGFHKQGKQLDKRIDRIISSINSLQIRIETVFLPYKASMWDSLESVWKAADADVNCDAYVIPIPYCDKNPDGSVREVHYEADQYPEYVPVTHYADYDFVNRHPDKIYIHNSYDKYNHVTSVDPFFYSDNLKNFTDELVYIPYFILQEPDLKALEERTEPDKEGKTALQSYLEGMENYILLPGVLNADKVIVQSEEMKEVYVHVLTSHFGEETRKVWEEKISGTGSPKVDKLLNTKIEDLDVPKEWETIITKPDGTRKKIILYNTGLSAMLKENRQMLEKIKDVFRIFEENKDEVALLWRPHPLLEATLASMRTELEEEYQEIKKSFLEDRIGIYDDSPDLDRAIVLSDAYYGDMSSVVWLYQKTGKPIMIQNAEILSD